MENIIWVEHRRNRLDELRNVHPTRGVEMDLRSSGTDKLIVAHDPWTSGIDFESWLSVFCECRIQGPLILNTKEDGLETRTMEILNKHQISHYLFLDTTYPTLVRWMGKGLGSRFLARISAYETLDQTLLLKNQLEWVWVDCFGHQPLTEDLVAKVAQDFKICLVSPDLQGAIDAESFRPFLPLLPHVSAICTKRFDLWSTFLK